MGRSIASGRGRSLDRPSSVRTSHSAPRTQSYNPPVHRFFAPSLDPGDESVVLPRDEAEHLTRVLRLSAGDTVTVFDGRGHEFMARVISADRRDVRVQLMSSLVPAPADAVSLTL